MNLQRVVLNLMASTSVEPTTIKSLLLGVQEVGSQCLCPELHRVAVRRSESGLCATHSMPAKTRMYNNSSPWSGSVTLAVPAALGECK